MNSMLNDLPYLNVHTHIYNSLDLTGLTSVNLYAIMVMHHQNRLAVINNQVTKEALILPLATVGIVTLTN